MTPGKWINHFELNARALNGLVALVILLIIYTLSPLFLSLTNFFVLCLYPFFFSIIFYYLLRPIVRFFELKLPTWLSILIAYALFFGFIVFLTIYIFPSAEQQMTLFLKFKQTFLENDRLKNLFQGYFTSASGFFLNNLTNFIQMATDFIVVFFIVPFVGFYLLKEDRSLIADAKVYLEKKKILADHKYFVYEVDANLSNFISARVFISLIISVLILVSFLIIGIDYPLLLFFTSFLFYIIPTIGFVLAMIPPLIVGFSMSSLMGLEVIVIMLAATILEGSLVTPKVLGNTLSMHPITVIFVLWIAGLLFGFVGLIFATPIYCLIRVTLKHLIMTQKEKRSGH